MDAESKAYAVYMSAATGTAQRYLREETDSISRFANPTTHVSASFRQRAVAPES